MPISSAADDVNEKQCVKCGPTVAVSGYGAGYLPKSRVAWHMAR